MGPPRKSGGQTGGADTKLGLEMTCLMVRHCFDAADCAVKHGLASKPGAIMGWPDWD